LHSLLSWIKEIIPGAEGKVCVDIQPMMDKAWAVRAGLGWLGKHTNLITTEYGSWVFIGELLLNLELEYDTERIEDHCGSCTLCIDACPTSAITEPYVVDSNKCISYATIELRASEIPAAVKDNLDGWLYGCDICQDVCPWNRFEQVTDEARFQPRAGNVNAELSELLEMTAETYADRFRSSAMKRAKLAGLQRNARALLEKEHRIPLPLGGVRGGCEACRAQALSPNPLPTGEGERLQTKPVTVPRPNPNENFRLIDNRLNPYVVSAFTRRTATKDAGRPAQARR